MARGDDGRFDPPRWGADGDSQDDAEWLLRELGGADSDASQDPRGGGGTPEGATRPPEQAKQPRGPKQPRERRRARAAASAAGEGGAAAADAGDPRRRTRILLIALAVVALLALASLFFLGMRLASGASVAATPTPSATPAPSATPTPSETPTPEPEPEPVAAGPVAPGSHPWDELRGGECLGPYAGPWEEEYTVVDCAAEHPAQLVYRGAFPADSPEQYPGEQAIQPQLSLLCSAPTVIDIAAAAPYGDLQVQGAYPATAEQWEAGQRDIFCFVSRSTGEPLTGSIAVPQAAPAG